MKTRSLIKKSFFGKYTINNSKLAQKLGELSTRYGILNYQLYDIAYRTYRIQPWFYDTPDGLNLLMLQISIRALELAQMDTSALELYNVCYQNNPPSILGYPWVNYPREVENEMIKAILKAQAFQCFDGQFLDDRASDTEISTFVKEVMRGVFLSRWYMYAHNNKTFQDDWMRRFLIAVLQETRRDKYEMAKNIISGYMEQRAREIAEQETISE